MSYSLLKIDELTRDHHYHLDDNDECYYVMEYNSGEGYAFSKTNDIISNLKKKMDKRGKEEWKWKGWAINKVVEILRSIISEQSLRGWTLVPIPPSKCKDDKMYDDRMTQILHGMCNGFASADIRELLYTKANITASHETDERPGPEYFRQNYFVDESLSKPAPTRILLFDDVLTAGAHFKGCKNLLLSRYPGITVKGVFVSRRKIEAE